MGVAILGFMVAVATVLGYASADPQGRGRRRARLGVTIVAVGWALGASVTSGGGSTAALAGASRRWAPSRGDLR